MLYRAEYLLAMNLTKEDNRMDKQYAGLKEHSAQSNRFVKEYLKAALLALMKEKSYKNLTVSELCKKAGVSRMAFYRNYRIINDLFHEAAEDLNW